MRSNWEERVRTRKRKKASARKRARGKRGAQAQGAERSVSTTQSRRGRLWQLAETGGARDVGRKSRDDVLVETREHGRFKRALCSAHRRACQQAKDCYCERDITHASKGAPTRHAPVL